MREIHSPNVVKVIVSPRDIGPPEHGKVKTLPVRYFQDSEVQILVQVHAAMHKQFHSNQSIRMLLQVLIL